MASSGPYVRIIDTAPFYQRVEWYRQSPPYQTRLPYKATRSRRSSSGPLVGNYSAHFDAANPGFPGFADARERARNKAYSDFVDQVTVARAQLGEALIERAKSWEMLVSRIQQLTRFAVALKRGDARAAAATLGVAKPRTWRRGARSFGKQFLEFHFGWQPLVQDIYTCATQLGEIPACRIRGRGSHPVNWQYTTVQPWWPWASNSYTLEGIVRCQVIADVSVSNPDLFLANRSGLSNPATVLWNVAPFTWILGWFVNVEDWLNQFTDLEGLDIRYAASTEKLKYRYSCVNWYGDSVYAPWITWDAYDVDSVTRSPGIATPVLRFDVPDRLSVSRGLTAISVLLQHLRK